MRNLKAILLAPVLLLLLPAGQAAGDEPEYVPGEVLVKFKPSSPPWVRAQALGAVGAASSEPIRLPRTRLVELDDEAADPRVAARRLAARPEVLWAEPNYIIRAHSVRPNDPFFADGSLWGLLNTGQKDSDGRSGSAGIDIGVTRAWEHTTGSPDVLVGVVDGGIAAHPDLDANRRVDLSRDMRANAKLREDNDPGSDISGHGTHVAGTIGAVGDNGIGVVGVNQRVGLIAIRALDDNFGEVANTASSFAYAGQLGLPVVNASLGNSVYSRALDDAIRLSPGTLFVVSAGNASMDHDGPGGADSIYPCDLDLPNLICVAAIGNRGELAYFSDYGARSVDLAAPGLRILSTVPTYDRAYVFPISADSFDEDWSTESDPPGHEWHVQSDGPDAEPVLASGVLADATESLLLAKPFGLSGWRGCSLHGRADLEFATGDDPPKALLVIERSLDGVRWDMIATYRSSSDIEVALNADDRREVMLRMRLLMFRGAAGLGGARLGDLHVQCLAQPGPQGEYDTFSGTSMAAPHVAGAAALLLAKRPDLTVAELRHALLSTVRPLPSLTGKTVTGGTLDLAAAMEAVERSAPKPKAKPRLTASIIPGARLLRRTRGVVFRVTSNAEADVTARAVIRWRGGGLMRLRRLVGGRPSPRDRRTRLAVPGRMTKLMLRPNRRQLRRLLRVQRNGRQLRVRLAVRVHSRAHRPTPPLHRTFGLR